MTNINFFKFNGHTVRTLTINRELYFVGSDLRKCFGQSSYYAGLKGLQEPEKTSVKIPTNSGRQMSIVISKTGLSKMMLNMQPYKGSLQGSAINPSSSKERENRVRLITEFKKWVSSEIIGQSDRSVVTKSIAKQPTTEPNNAILPTTALGQIHLLLQGTAEMDTKVNKMEKEFQDLKENQPISASQANYIGTHVSQMVYRYLKAHLNDLKIDRKEALHQLFKDINGQVMKVSKSRTRTMIPVGKFETVCRLIDEWQPTISTKILLLD